MQAEIIEPHEERGDVIALAEINQQIATARRYPRDESRARAKAISLATGTSETAEGCTYALKRDGKIITGPSVRMAEIIAQTWGNLRVQTRVKDEGDRFIVCEAAAHDLESNVAIAVEVRRRITKRDGTRYGDDMITTTANAASSIALRNAVFRIVPLAHVENVRAEAEKVAMGKAESLTAKRQETVRRLVDRFGPLGLTEARVFAAVGKTGIEGIGLEELKLITAIGVSVRDGQLDLDEAFPEVPPPGPKPAAGDPADAPKPQGKRSRKKDDAPATGTPAAPAGDARPEAAAPDAKEPKGTPSPAEPAAPATPPPTESAPANPAKPIVYDGREIKTVLELGVVCTDARNVWGSDAVKIWRERHGCDLTVSAIRAAVGGPSFANERAAIQAVVDFTLEGDVDPSAPSAPGPGF